MVGGPQARVPGAPAHLDPGRGRVGHALDHDRGSVSVLRDAAGDVLPIRGIARSRGDVARADEATAGARSGVSRGGNMKQYVLLCRHR